MSSLEEDFRAREARDRLGRVVEGPVRLAPVPLRFYAGSIALLAVAAILVGVAVALQLFSGKERPDVVFGLAGAGVALAVAPGVLLVSRSLSRATLSLHENGLSVERRVRPAAVAWGDVDALGLEETPALNQGARFGLTRTLRLRGKGAPLKLRAFTKDGTVDEMGAFLQALLKAHADVVAKRLRAGESLKGKGWRLDATGLTSRGASVPLPLDSLAAAGRFEEKVSLWKGAEETPFLTVPAKSENAVVLEVLAHRALAAKPARPAAAEGLGRLLFRRKARRLIIAIVGVFGLLLLGPGIGVLLGAKGKSEDVVFGASFAAAGLLVFLLAVFMAATSVTFHENGAVKKSPFGSRTVRYDDARRFSFAATRQYVHGAYAGTVLQVFVAPEPPAKGIRLRTTVKGSDEDLDRLRDLLAARMAARSRAIFDRTGEVAWTKRLSLTKDGVVYRPFSLFGKSTPKTLSWGPNLPYQLANGVLVLYEPSTRKRFGSVACAEENFYPGLALFLELAAEKGKTT